MGKSIRLVIGSAIGLIVACGGGNSGGDDPGDPVATDEAQATCMDFAAHAQQCGWGGNINAADWNCGEAAILWRADVFRDVASCAIGLPCAGDGVTCIQLALGIAPLPVHENYAARCTTRKAECSLVGDTDASRALLSCSASAFAAYANPLVESVIACFDAACADVVPCLDATL